MGASASRLHCGRNKSKGKSTRVNPDKLGKKNRRHSTSLRELVKDLHSFWKSSDLPTRRNTLENYFTVSSTNGQIEFAHGAKNCNPRLRWLGAIDFDFSNLLGSGGFGAVFKAKRKTTGIEYALKVQPIENMARSARSFGNNTEDETLIHMERTVLASCRNHSFIVSLEYAFYTDSHAVLGLEYVPGGTLSTLISSKRQLPFSVCKTYTMELIVALNFMHCKGIIYRDLKPSNILLTLNGHLKLTDFGLSGSMVKRKKTPNKNLASRHSSSRRLNPDLIAEMSRAGPDEPTASTEDVFSENSNGDESDTASENCACRDQDYKWVRRRTVCGTAGYRPPEQVQERFLDYFSRNGYDERADWFSLGVCCYTMLTGRRPFPTRKELLQSDSQRKLVPDKVLPTNVNNAMMEKVMNDTEFQCLMFEVQYPSYFQNEPNARDFIDRLLARDPDARLRYKGITHHPWMKRETFEEETILRRTIPEWVKEHAYLQSRKNEEVVSLKSKRPEEGLRLRGKSLSQCVTNLCSECFENNNSLYAENFTIKWNTKAREKTLSLFRHWNFMSDEAMKLEIDAAKEGQP